MKKAQKKFLAVISVCVIYSIICSAQSENIWILGFGDAIDFHNGTGTPQRITGFSSEIGEASAIICDRMGHLLFYTNGNIVRNALGHKMPNGNDLLKLLKLNAPTYSSHQGTVIVPDPLNPSQYYIFSIVSTTGGGGNYAGRLYYSKVDMMLDGGRGDVLYGGVFLAAGMIEGLTAIPGNMCNIWLLSRSSSSGSLNAFEITDHGVANKPIISQTGVSSPAYVGSIKASRDGKRIVLTDKNYHLMDFDPRTGTATNLITLLTEDMRGNYFVPEFSPDGRMFYAYQDGSDSSSLYQYNVGLGNKAAILTSKTYITSCHESYLVPNYPKGLKLGPDGQIYFSRNGNIDRISMPNLSGIACGHSESVFSNVTLGFGGGPNAIPAFLQDTTVEVRIVDNTCFSDSISLTIKNSSIWGYRWNTGSNGPSISVGMPGIYWVGYHTPPCNYHVDTFHVSFPNGRLPTIQVSPECRGLRNGNIRLEGQAYDTLNYRYTWMQEQDTLSRDTILNQLIAGVYDLYIHTETGCDTQLTIDVPEVDYRVSFTVDTLICEGDTLQALNTSEEHFGSFGWDWGDGHNSTAVSPGHRYRQSGRYTVRLTGTGAICQDTASTTITVDAPIAPGLTIEPPVLCAGTSARFYPVTDATLTSLQWTLGEHRFTQHPPEPLQYAFDQAGSIPVKLLFRTRACPDTPYEAKVQVHPLPLVNLGSDSALCLKDAPILLRNRHENATGQYHYAWNTGANTESILVNSPGTYSLTVRAEPLGCANTESIVVHRDCYTDIPNAFSPNGDGINDYFFPMQRLTKAVRQFRLQIRNRWGQNLFETTDIAGRGWDGRYNGHMQPAGTYIYVIAVELANGRQEQYQGNVTLIR